ncbi:hypothetical protein Tco_0517692 [Tanacetum coccineum]
MSTPVFVDPESPTQADGAQSSRVPAPFPEDPYEAIRQACLVEMETESETSEDPIDTKTPESPHAVASPTPLPNSTLPACHTEVSEDSDTSGTRSTSSDSTAPLSPDHLLTRTLPTPTPTRTSFHHRTTRMTVLAQPVMSHGHSARVARAMALSDFAIRKRYRSSYETSSSSSSALPERKRYRGEEAIPEGHQQAALVVETAVGEPLGLGYKALRRRELAIKEDQVYNTFERDGNYYIDVLLIPPPAPPFRTPPSPEWSSGLLPVSPSPSTVPSRISSSMGTVRALGGYSMINSAFRRDATYSVCVLIGMFRSLKLEQERTAMTFGALWRPVLAMEAWAGHVDTRIVGMSQAVYDDHRLVHDMLVQQAALQRELQEMRGRVTALERERDHMER